MSSTNVGAQRLLLKFKQEATTSIFNQYLRNIIKPGIYKGLTLTNPSGNNITISSGKMWINAPFTTDNVALSITFESAITGEVLTSSKPLIYFRFEWQNVTANYAELVLGDNTDYSTDVGLGLSPVIVGEGIFSGPTLTGFSYARRTRGTIDADNSFALSTDQDPSEAWHVSNYKYDIENYRQIKKEYEKVRNNTGGAIPAFKVVKIVDDYSTDEVPAVSLVTSAEDDTPIGVTGASFSDATTGFIVRRGRLVITGLDGAAGVKGSPVYCDDSGNITLTQTLRPIGFLLDTINPAPVYLDIGSGSGGGSGNGQAVLLQISQAHTFVVGNPIYLDSSGVWQLAQADSNISLGRGIVSNVINANNFEVTITGKIELTTGEWDAITGLTGGLVPGTEYYTSDANAGELVDYIPNYANPVLVALSSTVAIVQFGFVGAESGAGNTVLHKQFTGDATTTDFVLDAAPTSDQFCFVFVGGSYQDPSKYSLSGSTITISPAPLDGTEINVMSIIATIFNTDISQYVQRTTLTLANDAQVILNSAGTVFPTVANGMYEVWDQSDPNTYVLLSFKQNATPVVTLRDYSSDVDSIDVDGFLCIYISGSDVILKNRLGSSKTFVIHRSI